MLTPEQIQTATELRKQRNKRNGRHRSWKEIATLMRVSEHAVRMHFQPAYAEDQRHRYQLEETMRTLGLLRAPVNVPPDRLEEQQRLMAYEAPTITAALLGDPPPWRSALAQKQLRLVR